MTVVRIEDREGGVRVLTMDRPPANAINDELLVELDAALAEAEYDDAVRAVVLTGAGRFFSGGFDLRAPRQEADQVARMAVQFKAAPRRLFGFPKPTVAAVNGHCIAGGHVFAMACDHRLAAEGDYRIGLNEVAIGAAYPVVAMEIMRSRLSNQLVTELMLRAQLYPATEAPRLGLADRMVPAAGLESEALLLAAQLGAYPSEVYADTKRRLVADALARIDAATLEDDLEISALWSVESSRAARRAHTDRNL
ncbi:MAG: enoyl-CoA hydratase [Actinomycetota bacterium]|jgi:enoyl-CoA hydratase|nr:enoyl-CoA hydratase [Actinomycetota bacterium]